MPTTDQNDQLKLYVANCTAAQIASLQNGKNRHPFPVQQMVRQVTSDRITLAGEHLRAGDHALLGRRFRSAISRHYYAMYHAARAVVFGVTVGDDFEKHHVLPRNLPAAMPLRPQMEAELMAARLLRNEADYDPYPANESAWEPDARSLAVTAADFVQSCENFALANGLI